MKTSFLLLCAIFVLFAPISNAAEKHATGILLDVSRSVTPPQFEKIKGIVQELIQQELPPNALLLYVFGSTLQKIDPTQLPSVQATESSTILYDAVYDAMRDLTKITADKKTILIFSDGVDTKSVIVPEDIVSYAQNQSIVIHCIGIGKANRKLLERIAKLTNGNFFHAEEADLISQIQSAVALQQTSAKPEAPQPQKAQPSGPSPVLQAPVTEVPIQETNRSRISGIAVFLGALLLAAIAGFVMMRRRHQPRICPTCEKPLEADQTICPDCTGQTKIVPVPSLSSVDVQEMSPAHETPAATFDHQDRKQDTQEILSKTHLIDETPMLVIAKGKNIGQPYRLSKDNPVSIGRSRLNDIRPDDETISAQHCRIIPENDEYVLYDLGSTNGTSVNNIKVNKAILEEGDMIRVGATTLIFTLQESH